VLDKKCTNKQNIAGDKQHRILTALDFDGTHLDVKRIFLQFHRTRQNRRYSVQKHPSRYFKISTTHVRVSLLRRLSTWRCPHSLLSAGACYRSISPARGRSAANPPHAAAAAVDRWDRQTDRRTDARPFHRPCSAYKAGVSTSMYTDEHSPKFEFIYLSHPPLVEITSRGVVGRGQRPHTFFR